jgi:hypothetical protein
MTYETMSDEELYSKRQSIRDSLRSLRAEGKEVAAEANRRLVRLNLKRKMGKLSDVDKALLQEMVQDGSINESEVYIPGE